jgi:hypothetical protein
MDTLAVRVALEVGIRQTPGIFVLAAWQSAARPA